MMSSATNGRKAAALLCVLVLACLVIAGCSSSGNSGQSQSNAAESTSASTSTTAREDKNGFDPQSNMAIKVAGVTFQLPSYYGTPKTNKGTDTYYAEKGRGTTLITVQSTKAQIDVDQFNKEKQGYVESIFQGLSQSNFKLSNKQAKETELLGMPAMEFEASFSYNGITGETRGLLFFNNDAKEAAILTLDASNESKYDYLPDFKRTLESASIDEADVNSSAEAADNGAVSPDLKETMDSYEAFMDEYIDFMKRYRESSDTMSLLQDYTDYMTKYTDFVQKVNKLDTSKMSAADSAYYLEVTTRVSKKLLEASL